MLSYTHSIVLGALQGLTELFPISSLGHTVILPSLIGWPVDQHAEFFVVFLVATHLATALVLVAVFWSDWWKIAFGFFRSLRHRGIPAGDTYARLAWLLIIATIPAGLFGLLFESKLRDFFASPIEVSLFLIGNGALLYGAELLRRRAKRIPEEKDPDGAIAKLTIGQAIGVGCMQALALFPGFSRTGATLAGGLLAGLSHGSAARFSFLLATPIIFAAAALKLPKLIHAGNTPIVTVLIGAAVSAVAAYLSVRFLTKYFKSHTLTPFAVYCVVAGAIAFFTLHY
jgi:undecaprenyl-diphosphatase